MTREKSTTMTKSTTETPAKQSIAYKGLKSYLNATKDRHNGFGYNDFIKMIEQRPTKSSLAKIFAVSRHTMTKWLGVYKAEE